MGKYKDARARRGQTLPPYSPNATCPKCGHTEIRTIYTEADNCVEERCSICDQEHLLRSCDRCHYSWPEATIDPNNVMSGVQNA